MAEIQERREDRMSRELEERVLARERDEMRRREDKEDKEERRRLEREDKEEKREKMRWTSVREKID